MDVYYVFFLFDLFTFCASVNRSRFFFGGGELGCPSLWRLPCLFIALSYVHCSVPSLLALKGYVVCPGRIGTWTTEGTGAAASRSGYYYITVKTTRSTPLERVLLTPKTAAVSRHRFRRSFVPSFSFWGCVCSAPRRSIRLTNRRRTQSMPSFSS